MTWALRVQGEIRRQCSGTGRSCWNYPRDAESLKGGASWSLRDYNRRVCVVKQPRPSILVRPIIGGTFLGVPLIRTIVFWGLYWGPLILGNFGNLPYWYDS